MASWPAIRAVSEGVRALLESARPASGSIAVEIYKPSDFGSPMTEGVSLYLYRVGITASVRNLPPRVGPDGRRYRPSLPVDLHYLLTPWGKTAERQHELLGWAMRALEDHPVLPTPLLNQGGEVFREGEVVDVIAQPLSLAEMVSIWEFNKAAMTLSMTYVARMVALDSAVPMAEAGRVQTRGNRFTTEVP